MAERAVTPWHERLAPGAAESALADRLPGTHPPAAVDPRSSMPEAQSSGSDPLEFLPEAAPPSPTSDPFDFLPEASPLPPASDPFDFLPEASPLPPASDPFDFLPEAGSLPPASARSRIVIRDDRWHRRVLFPIDPLASERDARAMARSWDAQSELIKIQDARGSILEAGDGFRYASIDSWSYHYRAPGRYLVLQHSHDGAGLEVALDGALSGDIARFGVLELDAVIDLTEAEQRAVRSGHDFSFLPTPSATTPSLSVLLYSWQGADPIWVFTSGGRRTEVSALK